MSFGFGISDFLAVFRLATEARDRWTDAPKEYKSMKDETKNVENILRDIGELGTRIDLPRRHEADLKQACRSCCDVLEECQKLVTKYSSTQTVTSTRLKVRRAWARLQAEPNDIRHLRDQLSAQIAQLSLLYDVIETNLLIDVHEGVQDLQLSDVQRERTIVADWYSSADFADQQTDQLSRRESGTGGWFLARSEYQHWYQRPNSTLLCPGIPGSGKSMIVATVVEDLQKCFAPHKDVAVVYLYCNFNRRAEQDLRRMLSTLIRQLFQEQTWLSDNVTGLYMAHRDRATRPSVDELKSVLRFLVASYHRVFFVVDALDECGNEEQQRDRLLDELFSLQALKSENVNILATTRFIPDITQRFSTHPRVEVRANENDLGIYLTNRMSGLALFVARDVSLQEAIKQQITSAAKGMFLLARLQFDSLRDKTTVGDMEDALTQLEQGSTALDSAYDDALKRIDSQLEGLRNLARKVLLWITYAKRELSIEELQEAIAVRPGRQNLDLRKYINDPDQIVSVCHGLVEVDQESRAIRLVHYTAQEYFERVRSQWLPDGDLTISQSCIAYLSMSMFACDRCEWHMDLSTTIKQHAFLEYAGKTWGVHARTVQSKELRTSIIHFLSNAGYLRFTAMITLGTFSHASYGRRYECHRSEVSAVHVSAYFGLYDTMQDLIQAAENINCKDNFSETPLHVAAEEGHVDIVRLLLAQPSIEINTKNQYSGTPLSTAIEEGHAEIVQLLLAQPSIEINAKNEYSGTPLSIAAERGHTEVVRLLLAQSGIDVHIKNDYNNTTLFIASKKGHAGIVQLLLAQSGIDINIKNEFGGTSLFIAAKGGHIKIVQLLLAQSGINVNPQNVFGNTPLAIATGKGHIEIVRLLLAQSGIEVNTKDMNYYTPLSVATKEGHTEIVQLLLAHPGIEAPQELIDGSISTKD